MSNGEKAVFIALLIGIVAAASKAAAQTARLTFEEVERLAEITVERDNLQPRIKTMLQVIVEIESDRNPLAMRVEPHIGDASIGIAQTLLGTATWLYEKMGAVRFGKPTAAKLMNPEISMYFAGQYLQWLANYRREPRSEEFIVRAYNGGPDGINRSATIPYWEKYNKAWVSVQQGEGRS